jgi:integrase
MTVAELFAKAWASYWNTKRFVSSGWAADVQCFFKNHINPTLGHRRVEQLGPKAIRKWHRELPSRSVANRSLEVLSRMYRFAEEEELLPMGSNPCRLVRAHQEKKRGRYATESELARIGVELEREKHRSPVKVAFCYLLAFTGARPKSIAEARAEQLEIRPDGTGILRFAGKTSETTGEDELVILPKNAVAALQALPKRRDGLLLGPVAYRRLWGRIRENAGCPDLWARDLRRTFATVGLSEGVGKDIVGRLLNHHSPATTDVYAKLVPVARIAAANKIADRMALYLSGGQ